MGGNILYASRVVSYNPWSRFGEKDIFVFLTKDKKEEPFFCFLEETCGDYAIAFYRNGNECFNAQERLHGANPKKEPVFLLQNAIIFRLRNRKDVSKANYALLKELNIKCRGKLHLVFQSMAKCRGFGVVLLDKYCDRLTRRGEYHGNNYFQ